MEYRFGTELRASPLKRRHNARFEIPATSAAARKLNFAGSKGERTRSAGSSNGTSHTNKEAKDVVQHDKGMEAEAGAQEGTGDEHVQVPLEESTALVDGVQDMAVDDVPPKKSTFAVVSTSSCRNRVSYSGDYRLSGSSNSVDPAEKDTAAARFFARKAAN